MKVRTRRMTALFVSVMLMLMLFAANVMAVDAEASPRSYDNPVFYSGKVYAYNINTGKEQLVAEGNWSWGTGQPEFMYIPYRTYVDLSGGQYTGWRVEYRGNAKDCTYMRIHGSKTYYSKELSKNESIRAIFYCDGYTSAESFYYDSIVGGYRVNNIEMGGFKTK